MFNLIEGQERRIDVASFIALSGLHSDEQFGRRAGYSGLSFMARC
jgi:hypothetical protein